MNVFMNAYNTFLKKTRPLHVSYGAMKTIQTQHERIHCGRMWVHTDVGSLGNGQSHTILITPNSGETLHLQDFRASADGAPLSIHLYKAPFIDTNSLGVDVTSTFVNMNDVVQKPRIFTAQESVFIDVNSLGEELFQDVEFATDKKAGAGTDGTPAEFVLRGGVRYLVRVLDEAGGSVSYKTLIFAYDPTT